MFTIYIYCIYYLPLDIFCFQDMLFILLMLSYQLILELSLICHNAANNSSQLKSTNKKACIFRISNTHRYSIVPQNNVFSHEVSSYHAVVTNVQIKSVLAKAKQTLIYYTYCTYYILKQSYSILSYHNPKHLNIEVI
jgi:hypothetical protein